MKSRILIVFLFLFTFVSAKANSFSQVIKLPYSKGESMILTHTYNSGTHVHKDSYALDITQNGCDAYGKNILAVADGKVVQAIQNGYNFGYGTTVLIDQGNGIYQKYAHLVKDSLQVSDGGIVRAGQIIGYLGNTGNVVGVVCPEHPGVHLHFALWQKQADGSFIGVKPEPISGYSDLTEGKWYTSDNELIIPEGMQFESAEKKGFFSKLFNAIGNLFGGSKQSASVGSLTVNTPSTIVGDGRDGGEEVIEENEVTTNQVSEKNEKMITTQVESISTSTAQNFTTTSTSTTFVYSAGFGGGAPSSEVKEEATSTENNNLQTESTSTPSLEKSSTAQFTLSIQECDLKISQTVCIVPGKEIHFAWTDTGATSTQYFLYINDELEQTVFSTSTLTILNKEDGDYSAYVVKQDELGNVSTSTMISFSVSPLPIVINEINFVGTKASEKDEYIELYNNTEQSFDMSRFVLQTNDNSISIQLTGVMEPQSYYLIERNNDGVVSNIAADIAIPFALNNPDASLLRTGFVLELVVKDDSGNEKIIDYTPTVSICDGACTGNEIIPTGSYERKNTFAPAGNVFSWWYHFGPTNGLDRNGETIEGSPKAKNVHDIPQLI